MIEKLKLEKINTKEPFCSLFPVNGQVFDGIVQNMIDRGFDFDSPLSIWKEGKVLIDGHTRFNAAWQAGLKEVYVVYHNFPDEESALEYALSKQGDRRNLTDWDVYHLVGTLEKRKSTGEHTGYGRERERLAGLLKVNYKKIQKVMSILDYIESVKGGTCVPPKCGSHDPNMKSGVLPPDFMIFKIENLIKEKSINFAYNVVKVWKNEEDKRFFDDDKTDTSPFYQTEDAVIWKMGGRIQTALSINKSAFPTEDDYKNFIEDIQKIANKYTSSWLNNKLTDPITEDDMDEIKQIKFRWEEAG